MRKEHVTDEFRRKSSARSRKMWASFSKSKRRRLLDGLHKASRKPHVFSEESRKSISKTMSATARRVKRAGGRWGGGGWNKGLKHSPGRNRKQSRTVRKLIASGAFTPNLLGFYYRRVGYTRTKRYGKVLYASSWERELISLLDLSIWVGSFEKDSLRIPYRFRGEWRTYIPDFLVRTKVQGTFVVEVKPENQCRKLVFKAKEKAVLAYCKENGIKFVLLRSVEEIKNWISQLGKVR